MSDGAHMRGKIFASLLSIVLLLPGCGGRWISHYNKKADDAVSRAIYEELGKRTFYMGKGDSYKNVLWYRYLIREESSDILCGMAVAVNETMEKEEIRDKICLDYELEMYPGSFTCVASLTNYSDNTLDSPDYEGLQQLIIVGADDWTDEDYFYNNPAVYTNIPGIKSLEISQEMQTKAEEQGIDWYEVWPDLEEVEVYYDNPDDSEEEIVYKIEKEESAVHE